MIRDEDDEKMTVKLQGSKIGARSGAMLAGGWLRDLLGETNESA
jgi:hypothetical protein